MKCTFSFALILFAFTACNQAPVVDQKAEGEQLMDVSRAWAAAKTPEETLSYWAEDAIVLPPGEGPIRGKAAITKMVEGSAGVPGFEVNWEPKEVYVSKSGDLAYLIESNYFSIHDSLGNPVRTYNNAVTIWKKQADGSWKNVVDTWNADPTMTSIK